jgi:hypothetical protein
MNVDPLNAHQSTFSWRRNKVSPMVHFLVLFSAYVCVRPDIDHSVTTLSKFSKCPVDIYLKGIAKYLRRTICWKIYYTKPRPDPSLSVSSLMHGRIRPCFLWFPLINLFMQPTPTTNQIDAVLLDMFLPRWRCIAYKSKSIATTSSNEAEFLAALVTDKAACSLRAVLSDLKFRQYHPKPIHENNASTIKMINVRICTERFRHIYIQQFAILDSKATGDIILLHIPNPINPADDLTEPLRHVRWIMGHYGTKSFDNFFVSGCGATDWWCTDRDGWWTDACNRKHRGQAGASHIILFSSVLLMHCTFYSKGVY